MQLGLIFTGGDMSIEQLQRIARLAEDKGFRSLRMAEAWRSAWLPLTAMAATTERILLGPYILNAYAHSPLIAAMSAIDFQEFSGGRLLLGVGGGNRIINEQWQGIAHARVLRKMREYVQIMQRVARQPASQTLRFQGEIHRMEWSPVVASRQPPFPVLLSAVFPRMLRVAAQVADGIAAGATLSPQYVRDTLRPQAGKAALEVDRDPKSIHWTAVAITAIDTDREKARRAAREALCHLYAPLPHPYYEHTMREQGFARVADQLLQLMPNGHLDAAVDAIPDECVDQLCIAGDLSEASARLTAYRDVVDELLLLNASPVSSADPGAAYVELMKLRSS